MKLATIFTSVAVLVIASTAVADDAQQWGRYLKRWTRWNQLRTVASITAVGSLCDLLATSYLQVVPDTDDMFDSSCIVAHSCVPSSRRSGGAIYQTQKKPAQ